MENLICGIGRNSARKIIDRRTYSAWIKFLKTGRDIGSGFLDYAKFHAWVIRQYGYGDGDMFLSCISSKIVSKDTVFFLPKKLSMMIKPKQLTGDYGLIPRNRDQNGVPSHYHVQINHKYIGSYTTHLEASLEARKAMLKRIHALANEYKENMSMEAYNAIMDL